ncbi:hypothetical protein BIW11_05670 [Tropilaelaps mercedesae]|uniref:SAP domain-containing protein n=1 Tax=Tropilaelaps mercedesae TaxID=418985 RepID=A0A1V9Y1C5_9ACAR|nr:hypothetical protein BIW11_05670 [Tropilaelaps mercedesae]
MDIDSMTVADLKRELKARNLVVKGAKAELAQRLKEALTQADKEIGDDQLPDGELSDEGLLNEDDLLKDTPDSPVKHKDLHLHPTVESSQVEKPKPAVVPPSGITVPQVVKTAAALQKEGVLQSMEDDLFSDRPAPMGVLASTPEVTADKLKARAARFGLPEAKLEERAKKFGTGVSNKIGAAPIEDKQKLVDRAKRFGLSVDEDGRANRATATTIVPHFAINVSPADLEKLRKRAERFGGNVSSVAVKLEEAEKLAKRKAKFGVEITTGSSTVANLDHEKGTENKSIAAPTPPKRKPIVF